MNPNWQEFLGAQGARFDSDGIEVTDFGDQPAELLAAKDATVMAPLTRLGLLELAGEDTQTYLHNQLTSDVNHLAAEQAQHSAWCTAKGRMLASFVLYRQAEGYRALLAADVLEATQKRLQIYVLRSKVKITNLSTGHEVIGLAGPQADAALQGAGLPVPAPAMATATGGNNTVIRVDDARFIVIAAADAAADLWQKLAVSARPVGTPTWQWLDVQSGIPLICRATTEAFVPQMVNFDKIGGVSFNKGCYPGQEIIARTKYLGKVKRHLYRFHADGAVSAVAAGQHINDPQTPDQPCGMIACAAPSPEGGYDGLAVVLENNIEGGETRLHIAGQPETLLNGLSPVSD